jgi:hypothetical protein
MTEFVGLLGFLLLRTNHKEIEHNKDERKHDEGTTSSSLALQ